MIAVSNIGPVWTDERIATLKKLWSEGLSASQIANELACGVTRSAIIGKVHRLKLPPRLADGNRTAAIKAKAAQAKVHANRNQPKVQAIVARAEALRKAPAILPYDVEDNLDATDVTHLVGREQYELHQHCSYGFGDPKTAEFRFCGKPLHTGHWCEDHAALVYPGGKP